MGEQESGPRGISRATPICGAGIYRHTSLVYVYNACIPSILSVCDDRGVVHMVFVESHRWCDC